MDKILIYFKLSNLYINKEFRFFKITNEKSWIYSVTITNNLSSI